MFGWLLSHWDLLAGAAGIASGGLGFVLPRAWKWVAIGAAVLLLGGYIAVLKIGQANLRADLAIEQGERAKATAERDQEKATAEANRRAALALAASQRAAAEDRIALAEQLRQARGRVQIITREVLRDPSASDPLPGAFSPLLRRVRPGP
jgi:hypothetical protein